jgi:predicted RNase H-like nuclease (RuvC/YqgF family)
MNERPLVFSLLIGLIVVLVVAGVSLSVQINRQSEVYKKEVAKGMSLQKDIEAAKVTTGDLTRQIESLRAENDGLKSTIAAVTSENEALKLEKARITAVKNEIEQKFGEKLVPATTDTSKAAPVAPPIAPVSPAKPEPVKGK